MTMRDTARIGALLLACTSALLVVGVTLLVGTDVRGRGASGEGGSTELATYWEESTGLPSRQQRWLQYMTQHGLDQVQGWDGEDRVGRFPGDYGYVPVTAKGVGRLQSLDELDHTLTEGSSAYVNAHKYLQQLRADSVRGQKAYEAKKAAQRAQAMQAGMKQAEKYYAHTLKHGYGKDLTRDYWQTLQALQPGKSS